MYLLGILLRIIGANFTSRLSFISVTTICLQRQHHFECIHCKCRFHVFLGIISEMFFQAVSLCNCAVGLFVGNECVIIENTADSIEMLFEVMDRMGPKNHVLDRSPRRRHLANTVVYTCLLYTSPSPRDRQKSRMPSSA